MGISCSLGTQKDGGTRLVINYQKVNNLSRKDAYPLPRIDDLLNNIGPARWLSVADAWSGYLQVPLSPVLNCKVSLCHLRRVVGIHQNAFWSYICTSNISTHYANHVG